jgi:hypothetical protein
VELAARASGIKDATVAPIINHIITKGKALRSKKSPDDTNNTGEVPTQDSCNSTQVGPESMDIDADCIDEPVWSSFGNSIHTDTIAGSDCNTGGCPATQRDLRHHAGGRALGEHITPEEHWSTVGARDSGDVGGRIGGTVEEKWH